MGMEICENSGVPIGMVPCYHKRNIYIKRKLRVSFRRWQYRAENGYMRNFGPTHPHDTAFALKQWLYQKKLWVWIAQKCIALVGAETVLTSAGPQTTPFYGGQCRDGNGNMRKFGPTNSHGTAFAPRQWLYQKEATGMESSEMYCPSRCRNRSYQCGAANYPVLWGAV